MGRFYSGDRVRGSASTSNVRLDARRDVHARDGWNKVRLAEGRFYTRLYRGLSELQFTPFISWVNNVQYDTQSASPAGSRAFAGSSAGQRHLLRLQAQLARRSAAAKFRSLDSRLSSKLLYTYRF